MSREGVKPACCQKACCDWKDMLQDLYEKTINSYRVLNGLYPDGTGELRITAGDGIIIDTLSGNEVRISADELAGYSAIAPIQLDTDLNTISIAIDNTPTLNSSNAVRSGGTYAAIRARGSSQDPVEEATHATNADHQTSADSQTTAGSATNATHQTSADSATNANYQTSAGSATNATHQTSADSATNAGYQTSAGNQTVASKIGTSDVGDTSHPVFIDDGVPTQCSTISANIADKLTNARTIQTDLSSGTAASFDGSQDVTPGVTGILPIQNGGTGNQNGIAQLLPVTNGTLKRDSALSISNGVNNLTSLSITLNPGIYVYSYYDFVYTDPANSDTFMAVGFSYNNTQVWMQSTTAITGDYTRNHFCYVLNLNTISTVFPIIYRNGSGTEPQQQEMSCVRIA